VVRTSGCWCVEALVSALRPATRHLRHSVRRPLIGRQARTHHLPVHTAENVRWTNVATVKGAGQCSCGGDTFQRCHSRCQVWSQHGRVTVGRSRHTPSSGHNQPQPCKGLASPGTAFRGPLARSTLRRALLWRHRNRHDSCVGSLLFMCGLMLGVGRLGLGERLLEFYEWSKVSTNCKVQTHRTLHRYLRSKPN
jgi:hypothetical protein